MKRLFATLFATCGVGFSPIAPGTVGSLFALVIGYWIVDRFGWLECFIACVLVTVIGTLATAEYLRAHPEKSDPKEVVIDEVVGQWLTLLFPVLCLHLMSVLQTGSLHVITIEQSFILPYFALGFILFRLFDIVKPWPVSWIDRRLKNAVGVMADDLVAALMAGVFLYVGYIFAPLLLGTLSDSV
jgi:phosphatidylglycerophosphatase A